MSRPPVIDRGLNRKARRPTGDPVGRRALKLVPRVENQNGWSLLSRGAATGVTITPLPMTEPVPGFGAGAQQDCSQPQSFLWNRPLSFSNSFGLDSQQSVAQPQPVLQPPPPHPPPIGADTTGPAGAGAGAGAAGTGSAPASHAVVSMR